MGRMRRMFTDVIRLNLSNPLHPCTMIQKLMCADWVACAPSISILMLLHHLLFNIVLEGGSSYRTVLIKVPIGSMVMRISSPGCSVNSSGGTIPVPVSKKHP